MIIEQAFCSLPEILLGRGYSRQDYEGGIVSAYTLALLQELNGRNVNNPISCLCAERLYDKKPFTSARGEPRHLRADLHVRLDSVGAGTAALSAYGWRHSNWIEAKFFRPPEAGTAATTSNAGLLFADLIRLICLPPIEVPRRKNGPLPSVTDPNSGTVSYDRIYTGRYLMHIYEGPVDDLVTVKRNKTKTARAGERLWLRKLISRGPQEISAQELSIDDEGDTFLGVVSKWLQSLDISCAVTNVIVEPLKAANGGGPNYHCILTRIDSFRVEGLPPDSWQVTSGRKAVEGTAGAYERIRAFVGGHICLDKTKDLVPPDFRDEGDVEDYGEDGYETT